MYLRKNSIHILCFLERNWIMKVTWDNWNISSLIIINIIVNKVKHNTHLTGLYTAGRAAGETDPLPPPCHQENLTNFIMWLWLFIMWLWLWLYLTVIIFNNNEIIQKLAVYVKYISNLLIECVCCVSESSWCDCFTFSSYLNGSGERPLYGDQRDAANDVTLLRK
jgi:hypothetical protein